MIDPIANLSVINPLQLVKFDLFVEPGICMFCWSEHPEWDEQLKAVGSLLYPDNPHSAWFDDGKVGHRYMEERRRLSVPCITTRNEDGEDITICADHLMRLAATVRRASSGNPSRNGHENIVMNAGD